MSIENPKLTKILKRASDLEKGKEIALAKEFISIEEKFSNLKTKIDDIKMPDLTALTTIQSELKIMKEKLDEPIEVELEII